MHGIAQPARFHSAGDCVGVGLDSLTNLRSRAKKVDVSLSTILAAVMGREKKNPNPNKKTQQNQTNNMYPANESVEPILLLYNCQYLLYQRPQPCNYNLKT